MSRPHNNRFSLNSLSVLEPCGGLAAVDEHNRCLCFLLGGLFFPKVLLLLGLPGTEVEDHEDQEEADQPTSPSYPRPAKPNPTTTRHLKKGYQKCYSTFERDCLPTMQNSVELEKFTSDDENPEPTSLEAPKVSRSPKMLSTFGELEQI